MKLFLLVFLLAFISSGCSKSSTSAQPSPTPTAQHVAAQEEQMVDNIPYTDEIQQAIREGARNAAAKYMSVRFPEWQIKGMASHAYRGNVFWMDVDAVKDNHNVVFNFQVQCFWPQTGDFYWKVIPLDAQGTDRFRFMTDEELARKAEKLDKRIAAESSDQ
jgi:hypothetical protein